MTIGKHISIDNTAPTPAEIANAACARYGVSWGQVLGSGRSAYETAARGQIAALLREWRRMSWGQIADFMRCGRSSTVHKAAQAFWNNLEESLK